MEYQKKSVRDIDVEGRKVLVRVDFNVPQNEDGTVSDDKRIRGALPTIQYLLSHGAAVILCSHLGRPKGKVNSKYSLAPIAEHLSKLLGQEVRLCPVSVGEQAEQMAAALKPGEVMLLENLRFQPGEEANDPAFAKALAGLADIYVDDAFGTAHRAHASVAGVTEYLPAVCGFLVEKELSVMGKAMADPEHPFVAIMGGAKVSDKLKLIDNFIGKCDTILVLGGMAYTFFKAKGYEIGTSILDEESLELVRGLMDTCEARGTRILLPVDTVVADRFAEDADTRVVPCDAIPQGFMGLDIGPETVSLYAGEISRARTVVWNGPAGVFEMAPFRKGTEGIARAVADSGAVSIIGGGDSAAAIEMLGLSDKVTHISTGGGAALEFLEGKELPGVAALMNK